MNNNFELKSGSLLFEEGKIIIKDNARYKRRSRLFSSVLVFLIGLFLIYHSLTSGKSSSMRTGLIFSLYSLVLFPLIYFKSAASEINMEDVKSLKIKKFLFREFLVIQLKNNRTRRVDDIYNTDRLQEYLDTMVKLS